MRIMENIAVFILKKILITILSHYYYYYYFKNKHVIKVTQEMYTA